MKATAPSKLRRILKPLSDFTAPPKFDSELDEWLRGQLLLGPWAIGEVKELYIYRHGYLFQRTQKMFWREGVAKAHKADFELIKRGLDKSKTYLVYFGRRGWPCYVELPGDYKLLAKSPIHYYHPFSKGVTTHFSMPKGFLDRYQNYCSQAAMASLLSAPKAVRQPATAPVKVEEPSFDISFEEPEVPQPVVPVSAPTPPPQAGTPAPSPKKVEVTKPLPKQPARKEVEESFGPMDLV